MIHTINRIITPCLLLAWGCGEPDATNKALIQDLEGLHTPSPNQIWLSHEHILVDFIGADHLDPRHWNHETVLKTIQPYLDSLSALGVTHFVDATPNYLGRDVVLLEKMAKATGLKIVTNTGLYGAQNNKFIPQYAFKRSAEALAADWIGEFKHGINGTPIKPGFIKISVDSADPLDAMHGKLVKAAALTHLETGLTIASHTGNATALWPQLQILKSMGVSPEAFIWIHAQAEDKMENYLKAAKTGCWISLDGLGWEFEKHLEVLLFAKRNGFLDQVLISHDSGWYDPQKDAQQIQPYTVIFKKLLPALKSNGFTDQELKLLVSGNPSKAFSIGVKATPKPK